MLHSSRSGFSIQDIPETHVLWMLLQGRVRLVGRAAWNDSVTVETWPRTMERITSTRNFEVYGPDRSLVAVGESNWVLVNADTGRPARITAEIAKAYDLTDRDVFQTPQEDLPEGKGRLSFSSTVLRRDIDTNHHVNNRVYLDFAREALPPELAAYPFPEVSVRYRRQLLLGDLIRCYYRQDGVQHIVDICGEDQSHIHATVAFRTE